MPLRKRDFRVIISAKNMDPAHIVALEATALLLLVQWLLRAERRHNTRVPVLVDAKSVLGAVAKGRSSAPTLKKTVRRLAAHVLAGNLALRPIYVPSEDNPADEPSRGLSLARAPCTSKS